MFNAGAHMRIELAKRRLDLGLSLQQVADLAGISRNYYGKIELGRREPRLDVARNIARALGSSIEFLFFAHEWDDTSHTWRSRQ